MAEMLIYASQDRTSLDAQISIDHFLAPVKWRNWEDTPTNVYAEKTGIVIQPEFFSSRCNAFVGLQNGEVKLAEQSCVSTDQLPAEITEDQTLYIFIRIQL
jgi:hypothetical protein